MRQFLRFIKATPTVTGGTADAPWCRRTLVFKTTGSRELIIAVTAFGEKRCKLGDTLTKGQLCEVDFEVSSREWEDKWFTDVNAIRITSFDKSTEPSEADMNENSD